MELGRGAIGTHRTVIGLVITQRKSAGASHRDDHDRTTPVSDHDHRDGVLSQKRPGDLPCLGRFVFNCLLLLPFRYSFIFSACSAWRSGIFLSRFPLGAATL